MSDNDLQIFVGGLGRSGTTILTEVLGNHPDLFGMEWETRFIVDNDGLGDLVDALSWKWGGPTTGGEKLRRFRSMMTQDLIDPEVAPYEGYCMYDYFDRDRYDRLVAELLADLTDTEWPAVGLSKGRGRKIRTTLGRDEVTLDLHVEERNRVLPKYFQREDVRKRAARFVDDLFRGEAAARGKRHWCEKTPHNILSPHPRLLFPESYVVHIIRDPRDVISSIGSGVHEWGTPDLPTAARWCAGFYHKWNDLAETYRAGERYVEVHFEDLVQDPENTLGHLCAALGIDLAPEMLRTDLTQHNIGRHRAQFDREVTEIVDRDVLPLVAKAGFERYC